MYQWASTFLWIDRFTCVTKKSKWLDIPEVKTHYEEIQATKLFHCYIIESNIGIDDKSKTFINHVDQMLGDIDFSLSIKNFIVPKWHKIFSTRDALKKIIDSTLILVKNSDFLFIPIGKVIQHIFQYIKPADFDHCLKLYKI